MKRLLIIDAHSIIHRAFHALPPLNAPDGRPIQAVYGLARILLSILKRSPDYLVAAADTKERTFRKEAYEEYKAHRAETPEDLEAQMAEAKELFRRFHIPFVYATTASSRSCRTDMMPLASCAPPDCDDDVVGASAFFQNGLMVRGE